VLRAALALRAGVIEHDGYYYTSLAASLVTGHLAAALSTIWPPLYRALIALVAWPMARGGELAPHALELSARLVSVIAGTVTLALLARLARALASPRVARLTLALAVFHPRLIAYSASALTESTFLALVLAGLVLLVEDDARAGLGSAL